MIFQYSIEGSEWIIGLGIMFGLAFVMNYLTYNDLPTFLIFLAIFNAFMVWCEFLPAWTLIVNLIILTMLIYVQVSEKSKGGM